MGIEGTRALSIPDFCKIMDGHVPDGQELGYTKNLVPGGRGYIENPTDGDKIHCVVFVINAESFKVMDDNVERKLKELKGEADKRGLFPIVVLTKIDKIVKELKDNPSKTFYSTAIKEMVDDISATFGIVENRIMPVKNYEHELEAVTDVNILTMRACLTIHRSCQDYLNDKMAKDTRLVR